jgi:hypothetical protein
VIIFRFQDRVGVLDERSRRFLMTVAWLGGYVTPEQAQELGIRKFGTQGPRPIERPGILGLHQTHRHLPGCVSGYQVSDAADGR